LLDEAEESLSIKVTDKKLLEQFAEIDGMSEEKRELVKNILEMAINEDKIKEMVS
jgi:hypothetical protein